MVSLVQYERKIVPARRGKAVMAVLLKSYFSNDVALKTLTYCLIGTRPVATTLEARSQCPG